MPENDYRKTFGARFIFILLGFGLLATALFFRLFDLQVVNRVFYQSLAQGQHDINKVLLAERGKIFVSERGSDARYPAATNWAQYTIASSPRLIAKVSNSNLEIKTIAAALSPILRLEESVLIEKLTDASSSYRVLAQDVSEKDAKKIGYFKLAGLIIEPHQKRYYPEKNLGGQLLGFLGIENDQPKGAYGLEGYFNEELRGTDGYLSAEKDAIGNILTIDPRERKDSENGVDLLLTIDRTIQSFVCEQVRAAVKKHQADGGTVIVMNPRTGEILAMCSAPNFDSNEYNKEKNPRVYTNPAIFDVFEPGSIMKPLTMAAGLNEGKVEAETTYVDTGVAKVADLVIKNSDGKSYGLQTMVQVLEKSLNTGAVWVAEKVGKDALRRYFEKFGLGSLSGIELNTEVSGDISSLRKKGEVYMSTASFGQGISATPLQMITAFAAMANNGKLMKPFIVKEKDYADGRVVKIEPQVIREVITDRAARVLTSMLVGVVERGHGKRAAVPGYYVAGKTGTAQVPLPNGQGYYKDKTIGSFAGYAPAEHPRFVMITKIDNPKDVQFAESSAAPLFGEIAKFLLDYFEVPTER